MKTTLQIPDDLLREAKASAALRHASLKEFICGAIRDKLRADEQQRKGQVGWRAVLGQMRANERKKIDDAVTAEFGTVDREQWR